MEKYFELRENGQVLFGIVENIPEDTTMDIIENKLESKNLDFIEHEVKNPDIVIDWISMDYEHEIDINVLMVGECLEKSIKNSTEVEVVYNALKYMKEDITLSISEAIEKSFKKFNK